MKPEMHPDFPALMVDALLTMLDGYGAAFSVYVLLQAAAGSAMSVGMTQEQLVRILNAHWDYLVKKATEMVIREATAPGEPYPAPGGVA